jgi:hypothetical protein
MSNVHPDAAPPPPPPPVSASPDPRTRRFNRACQTLALLWLVATVPAGLHFRPTDSDFQQFYMGGLLVRLGETKDLYPIPDPNSRDNPGMNPASKVTPRNWQLEGQYGVPDVTHWMLPPASAPPLVPLSWLSFKNAESLWAILGLLCVWGVGLIAGRTYRLAGGGTISRWEGVLCLIVVLSPMAARAIRIRNTSAPIALCIGLIVLLILRDERWRRAVSTGFLIVLGALLKYATLVFVPLLLLTRRWRAVGAAAGFAVLAVVASLLFMDASVWPTFFRDIAPRLHWPSGFPGNQTIPAFLVRLNDGTKPVPLAWAVATFTVQGLALVGIFALAARWPEADRRSPRYVFATAAALVAWLMAFSPCAWEHWPIWLAPFWGWMAWEGRGSVGRRVVVIASILLCAIPLTIFTNPGFLQMDVRLPEPWNSSQLLGVLLTLALAVARLAEPVKFTRRRQATRARFTRLRLPWRKPAHHPV